MDYDYYNEVEVTEDEEKSVPLFLKTKYHNRDSWIIQNVQVLPVCSICEHSFADEDDLLNHRRKSHRHTSTTTATSVSPKVVTSTFSSPINPVKMENSTKDLTAAVSEPKRIPESGTTSVEWILPEQKLILTNNDNLSTRAVERETVPSTCQTKVIPLRAPASTVPILKSRDPIEIKKTIRRRIIECPKCNLAFSSSKSAMMCRKRHGLALCNICFEILEEAKVPRWIHYRNEHHFDEKTSLWKCAFLNCEQVFKCEVDLKSHIGKIHLWKAIKYTHGEHFHHSSGKLKCDGIKHDIVVTPPQPQPLIRPIQPDKWVSSEMTNETVETSTRLKVLQDRELMHIEADEVMDQDQDVYEIIQTGNIVSNQVLPPLPPISDSNRRDKPNDSNIRDNLLTESIPNLMLPLSPKSVKDVADTRLDLQDKNNFGFSSDTGCKGKEVMDQDKDVLKVQKDDCISNFKVSPSQTSEMDIIQDMNDQRNLPIASNTNNNTNIEEVNPGDSEPIKIPVYKEGSDENLQILYENAKPKSYDLHEGGMGKIGHLETELVKTPSGIELGTPPDIITNEKVQTPPNSISAKADIKSDDIQSHNQNVWDKISNITDLSDMENSKQLGFLNPDPTKDLYSSLLPPIPKDFQDNPIGSVNFKVITREDFIGLGEFNLNRIEVNNMDNSQESIIGSSLNVPTVQLHDTRKRKYSDPADPTCTGIIKNCENDPLDYNPSKIQRFQHIEDLEKCKPVQMGISTTWGSSHAIDITEHQLESERQSKEGILAKYEEYIDEATKYGQNCDELIRQNSDVMKKGFKYPPIPQCERVVEVELVEKTSKSISEDNLKRNNDYQQKSIRDTRLICCYCGILQDSAAELLQHDDSCSEKELYFRLKCHFIFETEPVPLAFCKICEQDLKTKSLLVVIQHCFWCAAEEGKLIQFPESVWDFKTITL